MTRYVRSFLDKGPKLINQLSEHERGLFLRQVHAYLVETKKRNEQLNRLRSRARKLEKRLETLRETSKMEAALRKSEQKYRTLFESIDEGFCIIEVLFSSGGIPRDYRFLEVNPSFVRHTGLRDAVGRRVRELVPRYEEHWFEIYGRIALTGRPERFTRRAASLGGRWFDVYAFRFGAPEERKLAVLFKDVTERQKAEEVIQDFNKALETRISEQELQIIERTRLAESRAKQLQSLAVQLVEAEERERRRFASLLHEDLQQVMASARLQLSAASLKLPPVPELEDVDRLLEETIDRTRALSYDLSPAVLHHAGLVPALKWLVQQMYERFGLQARLDVRALPDLGRGALEIFMFRAVQELLFNVVKHSGVKNAWIFLKAPGDDLSVTVTDMGKGFDPNVLNSSSGRKGLGLLTLRERASSMGGSLEVESAPGKGSRITLKVPRRLAGEAR